MVVRTPGRICCIAPQTVLVQSPPHCLPACLQDIALVESSPATFQSPYRQHVAPATTDNPWQCVLLRAGGHLSVLDMDQGAPISNLFSAA